MAAYRLALFLGDVGWHDVTKLAQDRRTIGLSSQLYEALGSISANLAEGYSRGSGKDRARFYEYALGSARESRDWYFKGRHVLGEAVVQHRLQLLAEILRLLLTMVPQQRGYSLHEEITPYRVEADNDGSDTSINEEVLNALLQNVPLPDL
jgi:four helix bundle protein